MTEEITLTELSKMYGYSYQAVKKWQERGMPFNYNTRRAPKQKAITWVLENILNPLREVDVQQQIQQEKLKKVRAEVAGIEMKNRIEMGGLIPVSYAETALSGFCASVKQTMLQIATIDSLEILEAATDQKAIKEKLFEIIEKRLNEIGDIMLSSKFEEYDEYSEDEEGKTEKKVI
ncbi:hypothetical protein [Providencia sp. JUb39]|uniref:hypothetical protein n=1 Tax=Providencia sp. JUb39 TaxID=2724165 RepID=UPI00164D6932|nr:hypothetical protein [Providencia sp. JUb39]